MPDNSKPEPWILTATGRKFRLLNPRAEEIDIHDIAASLSRLCRYNGHLSDKWADDIYSVAQHCVYVKRFLDMMGQSRAAAFGLMHDAPEAYYSDFISPLKELFPGYNTIEDNLMAKIIVKYRIPYDDDIAKAVKNADRTICYVESYAITDLPSEHWDVPAEKPFDITVIDPDFTLWRPGRAREEFLNEFNSLELSV